jgi:hypothetical protein
MSLLKKLPILPLQCCLIPKRFIRFLAYFYMNTLAYGVFPPLLLDYFYVQSLVESLAALLGLQRVGWVFSHPSREKG